MVRVLEALGIPVGLICMIAFSCHAAAQDMGNMSILSGPEGGTYHRFGLDIGTVVKKVCRADLEVRASQGSLDNLARLRNEPFAQLAIVQQDVLAYVLLNKSRHPTINDWVDTNGKEHLEVSEQIAGMPEGLVSERYSAKVRENAGVFKGMQSMVERCAEDAAFAEAFNKLGQ